MGVVSPCSITHWLGVQGNASGSSMPNVTNRPIRMQGSAICHHFLALRTWHVNFLANYDKYPGMHD